MLNYDNLYVYSEKFDAVKLEHVISPSDRNFRKSRIFGAKIFGLVDGSHTSRGRVFRAMKWS